MTNIRLFLSYMSIKQIFTLVTKERGIENYIRSMGKKTTGKLVMKTEITITYINRNFFNRSYK